MSYFVKTILWFQALFSKIKKSGLNKNPEYSRREWIFKAVQIYLCYLGFDLAGAHIYSLEVKFAYGQISAYEAFYSPMVLYYYFITGFCLANILWKLFEMYWWAKNRCDG